MSVLIVGTIGQSVLINSLRSTGKLDVNPVLGKREAYEVTYIGNPFLGLDRAMVIAGADCRGTAYGFFSISCRISVSLWIWWDDLEPKHRNRIPLSRKTVIQSSPTVRYCGIFINDEHWWLHGWAGGPSNRKWKILVRKHKNKSSNFF